MTDVKGRALVQAYAFAKHDPEHRDVNAARDALHAHLDALTAERDRAVRRVDDVMSYCQIWKRKAEDATAERDRYREAMIEAVSEPDRFRVYEILYRALADTDRERPTPPPNIVFQENQTVPRPGSDR